MAKIAVGRSVGTIVVPLKVTLRDIKPPVYAVSCCLGR